MPNTILEHVEGLADITGSAIASIATGTRTVYISGQVGNTPDGEILEGFRAQAEQALRNLRTALEAGGAQPGDVVKLNYYVVDWDLHPVDYVVPIGHRVGIVLAANDKRYIAVDRLASTVAIDLERTVFTLPVAPP